MNNIVLIGNLVRDIELKTLPNSNTAVANYTLAVNNPFRKDENNKPTADFINIVTFGKPAENLAKYMAKGCKLAVEGRLQIRNWKDKDGKNRYNAEVVTNSIEFLTFPPKEQDNTSNYSPTDDEDVPF